jgi:hypothetical protein
LGDLNGTRKCFDFCYENNYTSASCQSNYCKCLNFVPKDKPRLPGQSFQTVSAAGIDIVVFTPPKAGSPPLQKEKSISVSERCSDQGFLTSYPQPGTMGDLNGTRKCFDYCYSLSFKAAYCQKYICKCLTFNPTFKDESFGKSYKKVSAGGQDMAIFTPPKGGFPPLQKEKIISVSERCSDQGYLTSYPQPGTLGNLNGTRKCYDYCYSRSYNGAVCLQHSCKCLTFSMIGFQASL